MRQEFFKYLPSEIIIDILSRLPVKTIISCKCVCKSWLNLLTSPEFVNSHLSKSKSGLVFFLLKKNPRSKLMKIIEFEDSCDLDGLELHHNQITQFDLRELILGSANGLLWLSNSHARPNPDYICNPITREYIELPNPEMNVSHYPSFVTYGYGISKMSGQHKVVRIYHDCIHDATHRLVSIPKSICQVYTLGTGSWRTIAPGAPFEYSCRSIGAFFNGNLHWLVTDFKDNIWISCFDLETELFSTFSAPSEIQRREMFLGGVVALGDCLCVCDNSSLENIVIWLMKEYGVEKSWKKEYVISRIYFAGEGYEPIYPIKVFKDGDILMTLGAFLLFYYSNKTKSISKIDMSELHNPGCSEAMPYTPSFLSLKSFPIENAKSF